MGKLLIKGIKPLGFQWETNNPFLFCVHHNDRYPPGNTELGPNASLAGRTIGSDFVPRDGWRMYHGKKIPGFPVHPHRGFETITIVLNGLVDHADSLGAAGRYGGGDVQWMTAGAGIQHAEMFPLLNRELENHLELFQIWLNLPSRDKFAEPHYKMFWNEDIPEAVIKDRSGKTTTIKIIAGEIEDVKPIAPPPESWASKKENGVAIWLIKMEPDAEWMIPAMPLNAARSIYFYEGSSLFVDETEIPSYQAIDLASEGVIPLKNGPDDSRILLLQGIPIHEPVVQYGPFVMNTRAEIQQAMDDYRLTAFGGWPWPRPDMVHGSNRGRFARYADGTEEDR